MAQPNGDAFSKSGPHWIPALHWWKNPDHIRSVVACLVKGAYLVEKDRKANRHDSTGTALAPPWWKSFGFCIHKCIIDDKGSCIGVVYQYTASPLPSDPNCPAYVVAFRGTITKGSNFFSDMRSNFNLIKNRLHRKSRSIKAIQTISELLEETSGNYNDRVWLAGHSLGSSMAMLVGKHLVRTLSIYPNCFLFNPPFISLPIGRVVKNEHINQWIGLVSTAIVSITTRVTKKSRNNMAQFQALSQWHPHLFVHPKDPICLEYISYLKNRKWKEELGLGRMDRIAACHSILGFLWDDAEGEEPLHLIPSADLMVNHGPESRFNDAHALNQWWKEDLQLEFSRHHMDCLGYLFKLFNVH